MTKKVILYGADWCPDCQRVKHLFGQYNIDYDWKNIDESDDLLQEMLKKTDGKHLIPTLDIDGKALQNPSNDELLKLLDLKETKPVDYHDVVIIGAGPSALSAAIYTTREDIGTVLYEKGVIGGLAAITDWVDNYPGFIKGISGMDLADALRGQAERFGAKIRLGVVESIKDEGKYKRLKTSDGDVLARAVLIATGSDYKKIGVPGEEEYYGRGVHYCATCDGAFYRDKRLVVVGGGNSAAQEALFLTRFTSHIDMLVRSKLKASEVLIQKLREMSDKITIHEGVTTDEIVGKDNQVVKVIGTDIKTDKKREFETDGVFVFVGLKPNTEALQGSKIEFDELGLVKTDKTLQTAIPGVFASGDIRSGATMQIASAVGEGATAALMIRQYLEENDD